MSSPPSTKPSEHFSALISLADVMSFMKFMCLTPFCLMAIPACWSKGNDAVMGWVSASAPPARREVTAQLCCCCWCCWVLLMQGGWVCGCQPCRRQTPALPRKASGQPLCRAFPLPPKALVERRQAQQPWWLTGSWERPAQNCSGGASSPRLLLAVQSPR